MVYVASTAILDFMFLWRTESKIVVYLQGKYLCYPMGFKTACKPTGTGGPGISCRSPQNYPWIHTVLDKGYQVRFSSWGMAFQLILQSRYCFWTSVVFLISACPILKMKTNQLRICYD